MAKQNVKSAAADLQSLFDPKAFEDTFKTWATMNERMASLMVDAGTRVTDMASKTSNEAFANMRDLTQVRDEPAQYAEAYTDFVKKQVELFTRSAQTFADETKKLGNDTAELASKTGEEMQSKVAETVEGAAKTANSAAKKAA